MSGRRGFGIGGGIGFGAGAGGRIGVGGGVGVRALPANDRPNSVNAVFAPVTSIIASVA